MPTLEDRFWAKVDKGAEDQCWEWRGARESDGYGKLFSHRNDQGAMLFHRAHRLSREIADGSPIPEGLFVLHSCDNPPCVNPAHLRIGTKADNAADRAERGRGREHRQRGAANANAKLTEGQVRGIIAALQEVPRRSQSAIAAQFGIKQPQVSRIMLRQSWAHLWDE